MIRHLLCLFQENPKAGLGTTVGSLAAGTTPTIAQIPRDDVIFWFQVLAFTVTIVAGLMTAYATSQKIKKIKKEAKSE